MRFPSPKFWVAWSTLLAGLSMGAALVDLFREAWNGFLVQLSMVGVNFALIAFWKKQ